MKFGTAASDADQSRIVVLNTSDQRSFAGGAYDLGGNSLSGQFRLVGDNGTAYTCWFPASIQLSVGGNTMTLDSFTTSPALTGTIGASGGVFLDVGATLHMTPGQAAGNYIGDLPITCNGMSGSVSVSARMLTPFSLSATGNLEFGTLAALGVAGTVTIAPNGIRTITNVTPYPGSVSAASFAAVGEQNAAYAISLPSSATLTGPSATMTVDTFTHNAGGSPTMRGPGPADSFDVGATMHVGANQAGGAYSGTFTVTASYN